MKERYLNPVSKWHGDELSDSPSRAEIIDFIIKKGFIEGNWLDYDSDEALDAEKRSIYILGKNTCKETNWVSIHTKDLYDLSFWFTEDASTIDYIGYAEKMNMYQYNINIKEALKVLKEVEV